MAFMTEAPIFYFYDFRGLGIEFGTSLIWRPDEINGFFLLS